MNSEILNIDGKNVAKGAEFIVTSEILELLTGETFAQPARIPKAMFMESLYMDFPDISTRGIEVFQMPVDRVLQGKTFKFAYQKEITTTSGKVYCKNYYKLLASEGSAEFVTAQYVMFCDQPSTAWKNGVFSTVMFSVHS